MSIKNEQKKIRVALSKEKADIVIKNGNIVNVFTKERLEEWTIKTMSYVDRVSRKKGLVK